MNYWRPGKYQFLANNNSETMKFNPTNSVNKLSKDESLTKKALVNYQLTQAIIKNQMELFTQLDRVNSTLIPPLIPLRCGVVEMEIVGNNKINLEIKTKNN
jgi:hypothetical protein